MSERYHPPGTLVEIHRKRVHLADAVVVSHTDDSDEYMANAEQWLRLDITEALDPRVRKGVMVLRRPVREHGDNGWQPRTYRQIGRVRVTSVPFFGTRPAACPPRVTPSDAAAVGRER